jgi:hypothetical protein
MDVSVLKVVKLQGAMFYNENSSLSLLLATLSHGRPM